MSAQPRPHRPAGTRFVRSVLQTGSGQALSRISAVIGLVLLTRWLGPQGFAVFSVGWAAYQVAASASGGLDLGYVDLATRREDGDPGLAIAFRRAKGAAALLILLTTIVVAAVVAAQPGQTTAAALLAAGLAGATFALLQTELATAQGAMRFRRHGTLTAAYGVLALVTMLLLRALHVDSPAAYLGAYAASGAVVTVSVSRWTQWRPPSRSETEHLLRHSRWLIISGLLYAAMLRLEILVGAFLLTDQQLGIYAAPARYFAVLEFALVAVGTVLLPRASSIASARSVRRYVSSALGPVAVVTLAAATVAACAEPLTLLLLGPDYEDSVPVVRVLCLAAVLLTVNSTLKYLLFSVRRPGGLALMNSVLLAAKLAATLLLLSRFGAVGAAWSLVAGFAAATVFLLIAVRASWHRIGGVPVRRAREASES